MLTECGGSGVSTCACGKELSEWKLGELTYLSAIPSVQSVASIAVNTTEPVDSTGNVVEHAVAPAFVNDMPFASIVLQYLCAVQSVAPHGI